MENSILQFLFGWWTVWSASGNANADAMVNEYWPYALLGGAVLGFILAATEQFKREYDNGFLVVVGYGLGGAVLGGTFGGFLIVLLLALFRYLVLLAYIAALLASAFAPVYVAIRAWQARRSLLGSIGKFFRVLRLRMSWKQTPHDHLLEVDRRASEVATHLAGLKKQRDDLSARVHELSRLRDEADERCQHAKEGSAVQEIARDLCEKFSAKITMATTCSDGLNPVIALVEEGQAELHNLISLARLCRQAHEPDLASSTERAIAEATATLAALRKACEMADTALIAVMAGDQDSDLGLAFRQIKDGLQRSFALSDRMDQVSQLPAERVRA